MKKLAWLFGTALGLSMMANTASAQTQTSAAQADGNETEVIVVTASRFRGQEELRVKAASDVIMDTISQDEIGAVPDFNLADALRRVAGVVAEFDEDEGRFVNVRGIDSNLVYVTFDGLGVPTTGNFGDGGRNVDIEFLPSSAVKRIDVVKTFRPELDGSSVGGNVNIVSRSAFDSKKPFYLVATGSTSVYTLNKEIPSSVYGADTPYRAELTTSLKFGDQEQFGIIFSGLYGVRPRPQVKFFNTAAINVGALQAPNRFNTSIYQNDQKRFGGQVKAEYRKADTYASLFYYNYQQSESEYRWVNNFPLVAANIVPTSATTGSVLRAQHVASLDWFPIELGGSGLQGHYDTRIGESGVLEASAGWARQTFNHDTWGFAFQTAVSPSLAFNFDAANILPSRTALATPSFLTNGANYSRNLINTRNLLTEEDVTNAKVNYAWNTDDAGFGFKIGAEVRRLERVRDNDEYRFNSAVNFAPFISTTNKSYPEYGPDPYLFIDPTAVWNFFNTTQIPIDAARSVSADFNYQEDISAAFAQVNYSKDALRVIGGLRYEATQFEANAAGQARKTEGDYSHLLPSIVATYSFPIGAKLRAGFSQSLGRPNPSDLAVTYFESVDAGGVLNITKGNQDLKPREANNYDLSFEYYFMRGEGFIGAALFKKDIKGDIFTSQTTATINGQLTRTTQNVNAVGSVVSGLEISAYVGNLAILPKPFNGLGFSANATFTKGETEFLDGTKINRRVRQAPFSANVAAFYNWKSVEARLVYNYTDKYLVLIDREEDGFGQLDASLRYKMTDNLTIGLEGRNLTNANRVQIDNDNSFSTLFGETQIGRQYHLRVTYKY